MLEDPHQGPFGLAIRKTATSERDNLGEVHDGRNIIESKEYPLTADGASLPALHEATSAQGVPAGVNCDGFEGKCPTSITGQLEVCQRVEILF